MADVRRENRMSDEPWHGEAVAEAWILQILVCVMCGGVLLIVLLALFIHPQFDPDAPILPVGMPYVIIPIFLAAGLIERLFVTRQTVGKARREIASGTYQRSGAKRRGGSPSPSASDVRNGQRSDAQCLLSVFQSKTIVSVGMFEGIALWPAAAFLVEGNPINLGLAVLLMLGVAMHFPTRSRVIRWVEQQLDALQQEKRDNAN
jgi:hypothetical protein